VFKYPGEQLMVIVSGWSNEVVKAGLMSANFTPFRTITMYIRYADRLNSFENLVGNIVAFIPFGFILPMIVRWGGKLLILFLHVFIFVVGIEIFQLFSAFGVFDVDDILLNCLGAVIGWLAYRTLWQERFKSLV
jgi:glycopeptide antibiotics resistance protein